MMKRLVLAACAAIAACAVEAGSVLDELMPVPAKAMALSGDIRADVATSHVAVVRGEVPGAPEATADEAYVLEVTPEGTKITATGPRGEFWARVTLDQMVRLASGDVPCCRIVDWPRLKWRGFMLDSVRNYLPVQGVKDIIDAMSRYKLNLFHWHLTENYAWRLESKKYPQLQSERAFLYRHKGKFYTQEEFREIVDYAYARGICMMPEFDFPGHSLAFRRAFGFETMSDPRVAEVAEGLFDELCKLAPKEKMPFVHMGTDEVWKRDVEASPKEFLARMASAVTKHDRTVVSWVPGEDYACDGRHINMLWTDKVSPDTHPGPYFDAIGMYIEDFDPFEVLSVATYHKAGRWHEAGEKNFGAIFCAWHDGFVGLPYENLLRNQPIFPSCVLFGNAYWRGRDKDVPELRKELPPAGDSRLAEAVDIERRTMAQRDKALRDLRHPFHFLRQTDMRWRLTQADGTLIAKDIAQATITPGRIKGADGKALLSRTNGTVIAETWIKSPKDQTVGAWIGFTNITRDHGLVYSAPLPDVGEWNRFGAKAELNGEPIAPPKWKRPGLKKGAPMADWTPAWTLYEADEEPFTDQEYVMREPTQIHLRKGWNHVRLTIPNPAASEGVKTKHRWVGTFIPVDGTTDHPREVPGLEYSCTGGGALQLGGWNPETKARLDALIERNRGNPDAYAVFDFDYTAAIGDLSYVCMWRILERFEFKNDDCRSMITAGVTPGLKAEAEAVADIAEKLKPFAGQDLTDRAEWREFIRRYWKLYRDLADEVGEYEAYLWRVRIFTGYTPDTLRALARTAIAQALARKGLYRDVNAPTEKRGLAITPEMKDLFRTLRKAGIAVYIVSGSFQEVLCVATSPEFGLELPPENVFGADLKKDAGGAYIPEMRDGCVKSGHKPEFIRKHIAPRHHGADPVLTAGDSMGDYGMLTEFKDLQLALVFRRNWKKPMLRELVERGGRVISQGRDEVRGCFIPSMECIEPKCGIIRDMGTFDIKKKKAFVCDLDGTLFMGPHPIKPAVEFVINSTKSGKYCFFYLTNNTSKTPAEYMKKIAGADIPVEPDQILTPLITLEEYIREKGYRSVYLVASDAVVKHMDERLRDVGVHFGYDPERNELAALAYDKELTYDKLQKLTTLWNMRNGGNAAVGLKTVAGRPIDFVATHPDNCCPSEAGPIPDVGGMLRLLETTNGMKPSHVFGKPSPSLLQPVLLQFAKDEIAVVGDRLYTDKAIADNAGVDFVCVLSGETTPADLEKYTGTPPSIVVNTFNEVETCR